MKRFELSFNRISWTRSGKARWYPARALFFLLSALISSVCKLLCGSWVLTWIIMFGGIVTGVLALWVLSNEHDEQRKRLEDEEDKADGALTARREQLRKLDNTLTNLSPRRRWMEVTCTRQ